jgi:aspartate ammonia-lyase
MEAINELQRITNLPIARGDNLSDTTQNLDSFVEIHATLKAHAVNLEKISNDLRLLASDAGSHTLNLPAVQAGSSIMPAKVNPVVNEFVISIAHQIYSNDVLVSNLCGQGCLELNAYIPSIGNAVLNSLSLLIAANKSFCQNCLTGITVNSTVAEQILLHSPSITTALIPYIGYHKATELALNMKQNKTDIFTANKELGMFDEEKLKTLLSPDNLTKLGFSIKDL